MLGYMGHNVSMQHTTAVVSVYHVLHSERFKVLSRCLLFWIYAYFPFFYSTTLSLNSGVIDIHLIAIYNLLVFFILFFAWKYRSQLRIVSTRTIAFNLRENVTHLLKYVVYKS
jgi:hypothetical protein